jgi:hypothetical protein
MKIRNHARTHPEQQWKTKVGKIKMWLNTMTDEGKKKK